MTGARAAGTGWRPSLGCALACSSALTSAPRTQGCRLPMSLASSDMNILEGEGHTGLSIHVTQRRPQGLSLCLHRK